MCGRFTLAERLERLQERYDIQSISQDYTPDYQEYNIAPTQQIPIVRTKESEKPIKELLSAKWGYVIGPNIVINSRDDKIAITKTYTKALESNRCLIPANGFYEWKKVEPRKIPYYIKTTDQEICSFAGFYQLMPIASEYRIGCSILTTKPNSIVRELHDRMPVILEPDTEELWLDKKATSKELLDCLKPYPVERMQKYEVSIKVNSVQNNFPDLIVPKTNIRKSKTKLDSFYRN